MIFKPCWLVAHFSIALEWAKTSCRKRSNHPSDEPDIIVVIGHLQSTVVILSDSLLIIPNRLAKKNYHQKKETRSHFL